MVKVEAPNLPADLTWWRWDSKTNRGSILGRREWGGWRLRYDGVAVIGWEADHVLRDPTKYRLTPPEKAQEPEDEKPAELAKPSPDEAWAEHLRQEREITAQMQVHDARQFIDYWWDKEQRRTVPGPPEPMLTGYGGVLCRMVGNRR